MNQPDSNVGFEISGYRMIKRLGQGGMATVYLAIQSSLSRPVAIKVLTPDKDIGEEQIARFEQEARTIARLDHPHIVSIHEVGRTSDGQLFFAMPFLARGDLSQKKMQGDPLRIITVMRALADALGYAHAHGVIHRDVKPENILFDKLDRPLLADFGIALSSRNHERVTREGAALGSTGYMSPEQARGLRLDGRADLYSLGVVCYELLTGCLPYIGADGLAIALAHVQDPIPNLPPDRREWQQFINRAMAKAPEKRFQTAEQMIIALDALERRFVATLKPKRMQITERIDKLASEGLTRVQQWRAPLLVLLAGIALLGALLYFGGREPQSAAESAPQPDASVAVEAPRVKMSGAEIQALLIDGNGLLERKQWVTPARDNAAEKFLTVLRVVPDHAEAKAGLGRVMTALGISIEAALRDGNGAVARERFDQAELLADTGGMRDQDAYLQFIDALKRGVEMRLDHASATFDTGALTALEPLVAGLGLKIPELPTRVASVAARLASVPAPGTRLRDIGGPELAFVPASIASGNQTHALDHAFAFSRYEISRAEYAEFAAASGRPDAKCREPLQPWSRFQDLSWREPGFTQTERHPATCVSWRDAAAYSRWLSERTGQRYRLPTQSEWLHAARLPVAGANACDKGNIADLRHDPLRPTPNRFECDDGYEHTAPVGSYAASALGLHDLTGNVSEWTLDCADGWNPIKKLLNDDACGRRHFRGTSWRDGSNATTLGNESTSDPDVAYTTIGFRVLRELHSENLPGPSDSADRATQQ